ncbi:MAG TPA: hypothetical protein VNA04_17025 [Thermoanaerobaculia bacterium]|nr:hypothetical protein [Thermoanaerobaculia bacterium]
MARRRAARAGESLLLPAITLPMLFMVAILWLVVTLFVVMYEEPTLHRLFGAQYETYRRHVRRWIPRLTPFDDAEAVRPE